jgi:type II secretory pathway component GspD/PulD (secretin)
MCKLTSLLLACAFGMSTVALADGALEIIELKHRSVEEVIPSLMPLLEPDGVLTGMQGQLILRASPSNRAQIRQALEALDKPLRQLLVTVRQSRQILQDKNEAGLYGKVEAGNVSVAVPSSGSGGARAEVDTGKVRVGARLESRDMNQFSRVSQVVRVADGGQAFIHAGTRLPLTQREVIWNPYGQTVKESMVYMDVESGFHVRPQVVGERVSLEINPVQQSISAADPYTVVSQDLRTNLIGRLGEWIELGGGEESTDQEFMKLAGKSSQGETRINRVWLRVEVIE